LKAPKLPQLVGTRVVTDQFIIGTEHNRVAQIGNLEQAIRTVLHDARISNTLRAALEAYQAHLAELNEPDIGTTRSGQTEYTYPPEIICPSDPEPYPCNSLSHEGSFLLSCESALIDQGLMLRMEYNKQSFDWSVKINEVRYEGITKEVMEALIECAVIATEMTIMRSPSQRPQ
jgi:hypothetical protein